MMPAVPGGGPEVRDRLRPGLLPIFEAIDASMRVAPEPPSLPDLDGGEPRWAELVRVREALAAVIRTATEMRRLADRELAAELGPGGAARYGEFVYRPQPRRSLRAVDERAWWAFLVELLGVVRARRERTAGLLSRLYRAADVRLTPLAEVAELAGQQEQTVRDTFFYWEEGPLEATPVPLDRAPKYLQKLAEGEALIRRLAWPSSVEGVGPREAVGEVGDSDGPRSAADSDPPGG